MKKNMTKELNTLQDKRMSEYRRYQKGHISREEYCKRVKPLDMAIETIEMAMFSNTPVWKKAF